MISRDVWIVVSWFRIRESFRRLSGRA